MKKTILYLFVLLIVFSGCRDRKFDEIDKEKEINIPAGYMCVEMPGGQRAEQRISLTQNEKNIELRWQNDDEIELCFVQGGKQVVQKVKVQPMADNDRLAIFPLHVPQDIDAQSPFDLYGVYGGGGFVKETDPDFDQGDGDKMMQSIRLNPPGTYATLREIQENRDVVLAFDCKNFTMEQMTFPVTFRHMGYLICIHLKNTGEATLNHLGACRINALSEIFANTDKEKGSILDLSDKGYWIGNKSNLCEINGSSSAELKTPLAPDETKTYWKWVAQRYLTNPWCNGIDRARLELLDMEGNPVAQSMDWTFYQAEVPNEDRKELKGKCLHIYASWDDGTLCFTNSKFYRNTFTPLSRLATHNLDGVNTFTGGDESIMTGKFYEWGRNTPLDGQNLPSKETTCSHYNDPKIWEHVFFEGYIKSVGDSENVFDWISPAPKSIDELYWNERVLKSTKAPQSYIGSNTSYPGDPCPEGWHIPTDNEFIGAFPLDPYSVDSPISFKMKFTTSIDEKIDFMGDGKITECKSVFVPWFEKEECNDNHLKFAAIRFKGTPYRSVYRYELITRTDGNRYVRVTARPITSDHESAISNDQFDGYASDAFWSRNTKHDVSRVFPLGGVLCTYRRNVTLLNPQMQVRYWVSNADPKPREGDFYNVNDIYVPYISLESIWSASCTIKNDGGKATGHNIRCIRNSTTANRFVIQNSHVLLGIQGTDKDSENIRIISGSGMYEISVEQPDVAQAVIENDHIKISALKTGKTIVKVVDTQLNVERRITVEVNTLPKTANYGIYHTNTGEHIFRITSVVIKKSSALVIRYMSEPYKLNANIYYPTDPALYSGKKCSVKIDIANNDSDYTLPVGLKTGEQVYDATVLRVFRQSGEERVHLKLADHPYYISTRWKPTV